MANAVDSEDFRLFLSSDGTSSGTEVLLECQGATTLATGKGVSRVVCKGGESHSFISKGGEEITGVFRLHRPLGVAQALIMDAAEDSANVYAWLKDVNAGGISFAGEWLPVVTNIANPEGGNPVEASFTLSAQGAVTRGTVS